MSFSLAVFQDFIKSIFHSFYFIKTSGETPSASAIFLTVSMVGLGVAPASILAIVWKAKSAFFESTS